MGQWIVGVISFQKIFGLCGIKGHIVEIRWDVTLEDGRHTECEDRARILEQNSQQCERFGSVSYIGEVAGMWIRNEDAARSCRIRFE